MLPHETPTNPEFRQEEEYPLLLSVSKKDVSKITTFIFDIDGVLTDGSVLALNSGEQARNFYVKDGWAINAAIKKGYRVCIISGGGQEGSQKRLEFLGIKDIYLNTSSKTEVFENYLSKHHLSADAVLYMGDDIPDLEVMKHSGIASCPADAAKDILKTSDYISSFEGGRGAVRDVIEQIMKLQGNWPV